MGPQSLRITSQAPKSNGPVDVFSYVQDVRHLRTRVLITVRAVELLPQYIQSVLQISCTLVQVVLAPGAVHPAVVERPVKGTYEPITLVLEATNNLLHVRFRISSAAPAPVVLRFRRN